MTGNRIARIILSIFFVALLSRLVHQAHFGPGEMPTDRATDEKTSLHATDFI